MSSESSERCAYCDEERELDQFEDGLRCKFCAEEQDEPFRPFPVVKSDQELFVERVRAQAVAEVVEALRRWSNEPGSAAEQLADQIDREFGSGVKHEL